LNRRIVASLHGANGVVIQTLESEIIGDHITAYEQAFFRVATYSQEAWAKSIMNGCRVVIGIPDDAAN